MSTSRQGDKDWDAELLRAAKRIVPKLQRIARAIPKLAYCRKRGHGHNLFAGCPGCERAVDLNGERYSEFIRRVRKLA